MQGAARGGDHVRKQRRALATGIERMTGGRDRTRASVLSHWLGGALLVMSAAAAAAEQSREDAWWTGPMLAPSAATLPQGHLLVEPYLFDVMTDGRFDTKGTWHASSREHDIGSHCFLIFVPRHRPFSGLLTQFGFHQPGRVPTDL